LAGWRVCHVDEAVRGVSWDADDIAGFREEAPIVDLVEIPSLQDPEYLGFPVPVQRWPLSGGVDCLDEAKITLACRGRKANGKFQAYGPGFLWVGPRRGSERKTKSSMLSPFRLAKYHFH
jgi:hypothetical protein